MTGISKTWFVSYRRSRSPGSGHARVTETFESEAEAKDFARRLSPQGNINAGTINPHRPKKFFGSANINEWLAKEPTS
jgi:hypothetical protein